MMLEKLFEIMFYQWGNLQDDCKRRDFSINAIYYCPLTQKIFDEHNGIKDIANKTRLYQ